MQNIINVELNNLIGKLKNNGVVFKDETIITQESIINNFEDCLDVEYKRENGVVYTPQYIAEFMAKDSLNKWAINNFGHNMDNIIKCGDKNLKQQFIDKLYIIKILDPCVGAGVYPLAILNILEETYNKIGVNIDKADLYKHIISNNLYCIDLDRNATDITIFRLWAKLIEFGKNITLKEFKHKVYRGNSLVDVHEGFPIYLNASEFMTESEINSVKTNEFYFEVDETEVDSREKYTEAIKNYQITRNDRYKTEIYNMSIRNYANKHNIIDNIPNIKLRMLKNMTAFSIDLEFKDIIDAGGFDIIIGNPPYVSNKNSDEDTNLDDYMREKYTDVYNSNNDLYVYFIAMALKYTKEKGVVNLIISNKWLNSTYGKELREKLTLGLKSNDVYIINFNSLFLFEGTYVNTTILQITSGDSRMMASNIYNINELNNISIETIQYDEIDKDKITDIIITNNDILNIYNRINKLDTIEYVLPNKINTGKNKNTPDGKLVLGGRNIQKYGIQRFNGNNTRFCIPIITSSMKCGLITGGESNYSITEVEYNENYWVFALFNSKLYSFIFDTMYYTNMTIGFSGNMFTHKTATKISKMPLPNNLDTINNMAKQIVEENKVTDRLINDIDREIQIGLNLTDTDVLKIKEVRLNMGGIGNE